jgi:hypothetical protein
MVVYLKTATALGLTIPLPLLGRAEQFRFCFNDLVNNRGWGPSWTPIRTCPAPSWPPPGVSLDNLGKLPVKFLSCIALPSRYFREETKHDTRRKQDHANHLLMKLATGT